ncbi:hypothetical protein [Brevundimonas vesicularis]|jgi:hypothetical protein|uniref:hypothetical protein n=1 Tax=Brevundimonas vesicularis TaxID=41276 RepID=UPI00083016B2|nr:hypothetical protein [Brevundimonas vesicularis]
MSRVAIHLAGALPVDHNTICAVFREVRLSGGRVVVLTDDAGEDDETPRQLLYRLGDEFDRLFSVAGEEFYEWIVDGDNGPQLATATAP